MEKAHELVIKNLDELMDFMREVNAGFDYADQVVTVMDDIDASSVEDWPGIGTVEHPFNGTFFGGNRKLSGFQFCTEEREVSGLFGCIGPKARIQALRVESAGVCISAAGGIAGINYGEIAGCRWQGSLRADEKPGAYYKLLCESGLGGIAGINAGTIHNCLSEGVLLRGGTCGGGIVGAGMGGQISNCTNRSELKNEPSRYEHLYLFTAQGGIGGIVGACRWHLKVSDCKNYGKIAGLQAVGGIGGLCQDTDMENCINHGPVEATRLWCGGIAGRLGQTIPDPLEFYGCVNHGAVRTNTFAGGIVGHIETNIYTKMENALRSTDEPKKPAKQEEKAISDGSICITNCINAGKVEGGFKNSDLYAGGIVGKSDGCIRCCVNLGAVSLNGDYAGGIVGATGAEHQDCVNFAPVIGDDFVGGIVGNSMQSIRCCYSTGNIKGNTCGGVAGWLLRGETLSGCCFCGDTSGDARYAVGGEPESGVGLTAQSMGGEMAWESMTKLLESGLWHTVPNVTDSGVTYAMTPQLNDLESFTYEQVGIPLK